MLAHHKVDHELKLIRTYWDSNLADDKLIDALKQYQNEIKTQTNLYSYNEIFDLSCVSQINLSYKDISLLASIASKYDIPDIHTRLAIVTSSNMVCRYAKMYILYRNLIQKSNKEVKIFKTGKDALVWINKKLYTNT